jgi:glycosyltransferase involved in cell wall biosynthesis
MNKNRIKIAMVATNLKLNGISAVIANYISYLNMSKYEITLVVGQGIAPKFHDLCDKKNVKIIEIAPRKEKPLEFYSQLFKIFIHEKFDIVHVHGSNASIGAELFLAKLAGIKARIAHSHNTTSTSMRVHKIMKPIFNISYTDALACGELAGKWLFGEKPFTIIPNGVKINNFKFDSNLRNSMRDKLNLNGKFVIGHIGRFNYQKNHEYILKVFNEIYKLNKNAILLLVGNGPDYKKIKSKIEKSSFESNVILYGETNNPASLYMAMDEFIFPSRFEGLPVTLVEAQISGLPAVISDIITPEIKMSEYLKFISLNASTKIWAKKILKNKIDLETRKKFFDTYNSTISYYDIKNDVYKLEKKYDEIMERIKYGK